MKIGDKLSVTLVGPEYPVNVGHIARLLKNFGISRLYFVEPRFDRRIAQVYASHAGDLIRDAKVIDLGTLRRLHDLLIATTAIRAVRKANVNRLVITPEEVVGHIAASRSASLVFGRDTTGLRNEELAICDAVTAIDTGTGYRTLNVGHAVAILLYLASRRRGMGRALPVKEIRETFSKYAYELAMASGLGDRRAKRLLKLSRRMSLRSQLTSTDLALLVSLMRRAVVSIRGEANQQRSKT